MMTLGPRNHAPQISSPVPKARVAARIAETVVYQISLKLIVDAVHRVHLLLSRRLQILVVVALVRSRFES